MPGTHNVCTKLHQNALANVAVSRNVHTKNGPYLHVANSHNTTLRKKPQTHIAERKYANAHLLEKIRKRTSLREIVQTNALRQKKQTNITETKYFSLFHGITTK